MKQLTGNQVELSQLEYSLIKDLLERQCRLFYQRGKRRLIGDPAVARSHIKENGVLYAPMPCDSVGLDVDSLPEGVGIIDIDDAPASQMVWLALQEGGYASTLSAEITPSGGLHLWGKGLPLSTTKSGLCRAGLYVEFFVKKRITVLGEGRKVTNWVPLEQLGRLPSYLLPAEKRGVFRIVPPIRQGSRWNTLYEQVRHNKSMDKDVLLFMAHYLCDPPMEEDKTNDLLKMVSDRKGEGEANVHSEVDDQDESMEERVCKRLAERLKERWIYRLPERVKSI